MIIFDFPQNGLPDRCIPAILADMSASKAYRIAVEVGDNIKSTRDRCSGILRYMAEANPPWDLRFFAGSKTHAPEDWRRNIGVWRPACVVQSVAQWEMFTPPVSRVCGIVALSSGDARRDAVLPPRTVFVGVDDEAIVGEAFSLLRRRGLAHFAYVHTQEQYDLPRSHRRGAILRRLVEVAGCECAECGQSGGEDWPGRLEALAADLQTLPRPCGVVAYNDRCARETMDACHFAGLSIPSQIQIVGVDNQDDICENMRPRLTSVEPDFEGVGHLMAQHIDALLRGGTRPPRVSVGGVRRIAERDSTIDLSGAARAGGLTAIHRAGWCPTPSLPRCMSRAGCWSCGSAKCAAKVSRRPFAAEGSPRYADFFAKRTSPSAKLPSGAASRCRRISMRFSGVLMAAPRESGAEGFLMKTPRTFGALTEYK